jgi:predicted transcriptional regulator
MGWQPESETAARRATVIRRSQAIGSAMAESESRSAEAISELAELLDQLHRPLEAIAWRAVLLAYSRSDLSEQQLREGMNEINRGRLELLNGNKAKASDEFILCGVDRSRLRP